MGTVSVFDLGDLLPLFTEQFRSRLPLNQVHWQHPATRRPYAPPELSPTLVPWDAAAITMLRPLPAADLHRTPLLHVCLVAGEDVAVFRQTHLPSIVQWTQQVAQIPEARWLIFHFTLGRVGRPKLTLRDSVFDKLRQLNPKGAELCFQLPLNAGAPDAAADVWLVRLQAEISTHCMARVAAYELALTRPPSEAGADWRPRVLCLDGLGLTLQSLGLHAEALEVYEEAVRLVARLPDPSAGDYVGPGVLAHLDVHGFRAALRTATAGAANARRYLQLRRAAQLLRLGRATALLDSVAPSTAATVMETLDVLAAAEGLYAASAAVRRAQDPGTYAIARAVVCQRLAAGLAALCGGFSGSPGPDGPRAEAPPAGPPVLRSLGEDCIATLAAGVQWHHLSAAAAVIPGSDNVAGTAAPIAMAVAGAADAVPRRTLLPSFARRASAAPAAASSPRSQPSLPPMPPPVAHLSEPSSFGPLPPWVFPPVPPSSVWCSAADRHVALEPWFVAALECAVASFTHARQPRHAVRPAVLLGEHALRRGDFARAAAHLAPAARRVAEDGWMALERRVQELLAACYAGQGLVAEHVGALVRLVGHPSDQQHPQQQAHVATLAALLPRLADHPTACSLDPVLSVEAVAVDASDGHGDVTAVHIHGAVPVPVAAPLAMTLTLTSHWPVPLVCEALSVRCLDALSDTLSPLLPSAPAAAALETSQHPRHRHQLSHCSAGDWALSQDGLQDQDWSDDGSTEPTDSELGSSPPPLVCRPPPPSSPPPLVSLGAPPAPPPARGHRRAISVPVSAITAEDEPAKLLPVPPAPAHGLLFRLPHPVTLVPGAATRLTLHGHATASGIFAPRELVLTTTGLQLFGYKLPARVFRVHASPHVAVTLTAGQPPLLADTTAAQPLTVAVDYGRYTLDAGQLVLTAPPGVVLAASAAAPGVSALSLPLVPPDPLVVFARVLLPCTAADPPRTCDLAYTVTCALRGVVDPHAQTGLLTVPVLRVFDVATTLVPRAADPACVVHATLVCAPLPGALPLQLRALRLAGEPGAAVPPPWQLQPPAPVFCGQRWSYAWVLPGAGPRALALHVEFEHDGLVLTQLHRVELPAGPAASRVDLTLDTSEAAAAVVVVGQPLPVLAWFGAEVAGRTYTVSANARHWLAVGPTRGRVPADPAANPVALQLVPTAPGRHPLPAISVAGVAVDAVYRGRLVLVAPDTTPAAVWHY